MAQPEKPRTKGGYRREETRQVESACLTVALTLGSLLDHLCIVGGLVPSLIIDREHPPDGEHHVGSNDLDIGLSIALLDDQQYTEISKRLRQEGFEPDVNEQGNPTPQRWRMGNLKVTVDFLMPAIASAGRGSRIQHLEGDFAAVIVPGLELAFEERQELIIEGHALTGEALARRIPVCGPATFIVLKALALHKRGEPKDAYDLIYVVRQWPAGISDLAERLASRAANHPGIVAEALNCLASDFATLDSIGPRRAGEFEEATGADLDEVAADAQGFIDDLLRACHARGLVES